MRYFDEMQSKWGFNDGNAIPDGIVHYRSAYIRLLNQAFKVFDKPYRAVAYDRGGLHNWCLLVIFNKQDLDDRGILDYTKGNWTWGMDLKEVPDNETMEIIDYLMDNYWDIDEVVETTITVNEELMKEALEELSKER